jgi:hypothetical protein
MSFDLLSSVALLAPPPHTRLARGQVGTVVEVLDSATALVEFVDDRGNTYALEQCARKDLLVLHYRATSS